jgi:hypothetical protein
MKRKRREDKDKSKKKKNLLDFLKMSPTWIHLIYEDKLIQI